MTYYKIENGKYAGEVEQDAFYGSVSDTKPPEFNEETHVALFVGWDRGYWEIISLDEYKLMYPDPKDIIVVPQMLTPRQARLALLNAGLLDEVETLLANDRAMQIWWEYSLDIQRNHEHVVAIGSALELTETQLDELFIEGAKL